ncbi:hypothetical protein [Pseudoduganella buxea]|uniref:Alginate biosynthesis protein AlgF n=1 Tax=Pseudoduganella buxea TaxID=1949069 RepID=A0A6I3SXZ6_9BURK|nr:hypothetical protein [Pseudoduganella buxea]MTV54088.1 hypothetical protein [Pseudoduganella buxea]GGC14500.1 hypothetical protein GCM10011572_39940 [Pseudoduganella buxea]
MKCSILAGLLAAAFFHPLAVAGDLSRYRLTLPAGAGAREEGGAIVFSNAAAAEVRVGALVVALDPPADVPFTADLILLSRPGQALPATRHAIPVVAPAGTVTQTGAEPVYALDTWQALTVRKGATLLRITALPDPRGHGAAPAALTVMLDFGEPCRILVHGETLGLREIEGIPRHFPGARLALLRDEGEPVLLAVDGAQATLRRGLRGEVHRFGTPSCR